MGSLITEEIKYNLHSDEYEMMKLRTDDEVRGYFYGRHMSQHQLQYSKIKVKKDWLWKQRTQNHETRRFGLIESLHMQHCSLRGCIRPLALAYAVFDFQNKQDGLNDSKENKI